MHKVNRISLISLFLVVLLGFFAITPLLKQGFFIMHDSQQVARLFELDKSLTAGQFPVRWVPDLGFGYGYPLFNFYPPIVYYLGELGVFAGLGYLGAIKMVWLVALIGSGITMYFFSKEFFGKLGGIVSAVFYVYAPYHAVDAYVRGALAELFSFVCLPLILLFSYKSVRSQNLVWNVSTGLSLGLLLLTHNLIFLPFFGLFTLWYSALCLIYLGKKKFILAASSYLLAALICFGLTAFFWLPALWEKQYTLVDQLLTKNLASYKIHFVCLSQLWNSPWGYGGSTAGCTDGISFMIGKIYIFSALMSLVGVFYLYKNNAKKLALVILISHFSFLISVFMTTDYSKFIWDAIPQLWYLQFPWRFLEFVALFSSFLAGSVFVMRNNMVRLGVASILIFLVILVEGKYFQPQMYLPQISDKELTRDHEIKWTVSSTSFEYLPQGTATKVTDKGALWIDITEKELTSSKYQVVKGDLLIKTERFLPDHFVIDGQSEQGATIKFSVVNFPGWKVWIDGDEAKIADNNKYKLITIELPRGEHLITGKFTNTPVRSLGNGLSVSSFLILTGILILHHFKMTKWTKLWK